jgi:Rrf2 family iron-sulfur cluster assembly transcriptional regulator
MISKTGIHAILALALLAKLKPGEYAGAARIAGTVGAPQNYLGKLLQQLAGEGLVESQKGFGGGFRLARPASRISLYEVVEPLEKVSRWNGCFLGQVKCDGHAPCAVHDRWSKIREKYMSFLHDTTVQEVAEDAVALEG